MPKKTKKQQTAALLDEKLPAAHRMHMLARMCVEGGEENEEIVTTVLKAAASGSGQMIYEAQVEEMDQRLQQLEQGPLRLATYQHMLEGRVGSRAYVLLEDGSSAFVAVPDPELAATLRRGDTVLIDAQGKAVLFRDSADAPSTGELARYERRIDGERIEVVLREHERSVYWTSQQLAGQLDDDTIKTGRMLIACSRRRMAFEAMPVEDGPSRYDFLVRDPVPKLNVDDLGSPPAYVKEIIDTVRTEMTNPRLRRRYRLNAAMMKLLTGPTGTGKTYSIYALWRELYKVMSEVTGVPIDELPPRVMRLRMPEVLSHWLGDSDKRLDRFFAEAEELAAELFVAPDGRRYVLPTLVILEELDGLARTRGHDTVYDRILTTALQRMDTSRPELRDRLILYLATSNVPQQIDAAMLRRAGGTLEHFGRLGRREFRSVLDKQLADRPVALTNGESAERARSQLVSDVTAWLFAPEHADVVQVELSYAGSATREAKYRRHFMTPALVDRAMQTAATAAVRIEERGETDTPGLTVELLFEALDRQVDGLAEVLHPTNAQDYLDLPDGVRVAQVHRPRRASIRPVELEAVN